MSYPFSQMNEARGDPPEQSEDSETASSTSRVGSVVDSGFWSQVLEILLFPLPGVGQSLNKFGLAVAFIIWVGIPAGLIIWGIYLNK
jgi:hypothetical protein